MFLPARNELDVTNSEQIYEYFNKVKADILINNAGVILLKSIKDSSFEEHKKIIDINLCGVFLCTNAVLKNNPKAKIINIASAAGTKVHANWSSYCASKAGVIMATKCWAEEGIDVICISPGRTLTKMRKFMYPDENPDTLMDTKYIALLVKKALNGHFKAGTNLEVNLSNVKELLNE